MIRSGGRKIYRDVMSRKFRTFLVAASIFVGVLGVIALFTASNLIIKQLDEDIQESELTMIDLTVSISSDVVPDNAFYLETLNRQNAAGQAIDALAGIEIAEGWAYYAISFKDPQTGDFEEGELRAYSTLLQDVRLEPMRLLDGAFPEVGQRQVALEKRLVDKYGFAIGDEIIFRTFSADGVTESAYIVSGIVFHPYSTRGVAGELPGPSVGIYAQYDDAQALLGFTGFSRFVARYETFELAENNFEGFVRAVTEITPYVPVIPAIEDPAENAQVAGATIFTNILNSLALTAMIVSGFLVINVVNTIIAEQRRQIGILKSIGASDLECFFIFSGVALVYGMLGTVLAIIPGILVGQAITNFLAPVLDIVIEGFNWSPQAVGFGVFMGIVVPVLAAIIPVYNGTRVKIMDAMTDLGISADYGTGIVPRLIAAIPLPIGIRQSISNVYQKRWRLMLTGITLTTTAATFMGTTVLTVTLSQEIRNLFDRLGYEILVFPNEIGNAEETSQALLDIDGVQSVSPASIAFVQFEGDFLNFFTGDNQVQIFGLDPTDDILAFNYVEGEGWSSDSERDGIVISTSIAKQLGKTAGDRMEIVVGGQPHTIEIIGVDSGAWDAANMHWRQLSELVGFADSGIVPNSYFVTPSMEGFTGLIVAVGMDETLLTFLAPELDTQNPGVIITQAFAEAADLAAGDTVTLTIGDKNVDRTVEAVVPNALLEANAAQLGVQAELLPDNIVLFGFNDLVGVTGVDTEGEPVPNGYYVTLENRDLAADEVDDMIDVLETEMLDKGIPAMYENQTANADLAVSQVQTNTSLFFVAALLIAVVGAIGLLTTLTISVFERQKEIGVMRSLGASSATVAIQFLSEGLIVGVISWLIALPISYVIAVVFYQSIGLENVQFDYPPIVPIIGLVGMIVIVAIASLGPSLSAARKTVSDILRYQ